MSRYGSALTLLSTPRPAESPAAPRGSAWDEAGSAPRVIHRALELADGFQHVPGVARTRGWKLAGRAQGSAGAT